MQVHALFLFEFIAQKVNDPQVEILAAQEGVAIGGQHLKLMFAIDLGDLDDGHVKGAAAEIIDHDPGVAALFIHAIGQRCRGRLVDDAPHLKPGDAARVLGRLALRIVKIGRHGDHGLLDLLAQIVLGRLLHLHQDPRGDLGRRHLLALDLHPGVAVVGLDDLVRHELDIFLHRVFLETAADQALDGVQGVVRVGHGLPLGGLADQDLIAVRIGNDGRGGPRALAVLDYLRLPAFEHRDTGIGRAEVYSDHLCHLSSPQCLHVGG